MTAQANEQIDPVELKKKSELWNKEQLVKIQKYCFSKGIQIKGFKNEKCLSLAPIVAVWYLQSTVKGEDYWVISGELPTDIAPIKVAKDERDVIRYFAMSWQLKAVRIEEAIAEGKQLGDKETQQKMMDELIKKGEALAAMHRDEKLWQGSGLTIS